MVLECPVMVWVKIVTSPNFDIRMVVSCDGLILTYINIYIYIYDIKIYWTYKKKKTWLLNMGLFFSAAPMDPHSHPTHNLDIARFVSVVGSVCGWLDPSSDWNVFGSTWINKNITKSLYSSEHRMNPKLVNRSQLLQECLERKSTGTPWTPPNFSW